MLAYELLCEEVEQEYGETETYGNVSSFAVTIDNVGDDSRQ